MFVAKVFKTIKKKCVFLELFCMYRLLLKVKPSSKQTGKKYYFDIGLHSSASELRLVSKWLSNHEVKLVGIEANPKHYCAALDGLYCPGTNLINVAIVGPEHVSNKVKMYVDQVGSGLGDTLLEERAIQRKMQHIEVNATRLSILFDELGINFHEDIIIIRMNIEGSEVFVLQDLIEAGIISNIDAFMGSWDDAHKISKMLGEQQDKIMNRYSVQPMQFNSRDIKGPFSSLKSHIIKSYLYKVLNI